MESENSNVQPGSEPNTVVIQNATVTGPTKTVFGAFGAPTPQWAKLIFRFYFYITGIVTLGLDTFGDMSPDTKLLITKIMIISNFAVHSFTQSFGIKLDEDK